MSVDAFRAALHGSGKSGHPESGRKGERSEQEAYHAHNSPSRFLAENI